MAKSEGDCSRVDVAGQEHLHVYRFAKTWPRNSKFTLATYTRTYSKRQKRVAHVVHTVR